MRGVVTPLRASTIGLPVLFSSDSISSGVAVGLRAISTAAAPAACGVACDVPAYVDVPPPRPSDVMSAPGPRRSSVAFESLKQATWSAAVVLSWQEPNANKPTLPSYTAPTDTAASTHAGAPISFAEASLPLQAKTSVPRARNVRTACAKSAVNDAAESQ